jgi:hypothetical protein
VVQHIKQEEDREVGKEKEKLVEDEKCGGREEESE